MIKNTKQTPIARPLTFMILFALAAVILVSAPALPVGAEDNGLINLPSYENSGPGDDSTPPEALPEDEAPPSEAEEPIITRQPEVQSSSTSTRTPPAPIYYPTDDEVGAPEVAGVSVADNTPAKKLPHQSKPETARAFAASVPESQPNRLLIGIACLSVALMAGLGVHKAKKARKHIKN